MPHKPKDLCKQVIGGAAMALRSCGGDLQLRHVGGRDRGRGDARQRARRPSAALAQLLLETVEGLKAKI